jgi:hypothetical protein
VGIISGANLSSDGLVYSLDAANFRSYSGSGLTSFGLVGGIGGTLVNGVGFTSSNGGSFIFDRTNDYISIPDNSLLNTFSDMTLEVIVKYTTTNDQIFAQKWNYSGGSQGYTIELYSNEIAAACYTGNNYLRVSVSNYPANNIYHMILTLLGTTQTLYINGVSVASNSGGSIPNISGTTFTIGNRSNLTGTYFGGNVYQTKFYNRALSAQEIKQNYNATKKRYGL